MVRTITVSNVNQALSNALWYLNTAGQVEPSRNGDVLVAPEPVITTYRQPKERVLFSPKRNANPFFHLMESLWMLAGRNDLEWPMFFNGRFQEYSDDGKIINGAYGYRWRHRFQKDQLMVLVDHLKAEPNSRRAVLTMWDATTDLGAQSRDFPCNTHVYFDLRGGVLNMTVCCRSNDLLWGAYGANVVHFSMLQEYLAGWLKVEVGEYRQFSNNFHLYLDILSESELTFLALDAEAYDEYRTPHIRPQSIYTSEISMDLWDQDLSWFLSDPYGDTEYAHAFFNGVVAPMYAAWHDRKHGYNSGILSAQAITAPDWRIACVGWINRAEQKKRDLHERA